MSPIISRATVTGILAAISVVLLFGCSSQNSQSYFDPQTGKHPAGWISTHSLIFLSNPSKCYECHGVDLRGGISKVSCFSASFNGIACHPNGPGHPDPAAWANPDQHGAAAKAAPNVVAMHGFSTCQLCHGTNFTGGFSNQTCLNTAGCHGVGVMAPHSQHWMPTDPRQHNTTDPGNAPVCALCHLAGANSPLGPIPPLPGVLPGCFNSTLCHGQLGHPANWALPAQHGARAKAAPNAATTSGFSVCQTCHGADFTGGTSLQTCLNTAGCHGVGVMSPHPQNWLPTDTYKHSTTDTANAPVCGLCHLGNPATPTYTPLPPGANPGCFNNTLCHGAVTHPAGWADPTQLGARAKAAPNVATTSGFSTCQTCHGNDFTGGTSLQTCLNTAGCHGAGVMAPHPQNWLPNDTYRHNSTNSGNAAVCALCHYNNRNPPAYVYPIPAGLTPGCTNNSLCHGN
jgi:cytochrome c553